jgi:hypothetical protein
MKKKTERPLFASAKINVKIIKSRGKEYKQRWIYCPSTLVDSGKWPFQDNEPVLFVIDEPRHRVVIQKITPEPV